MSDPLPPPASQLTPDGKMPPCRECNQRPGEVLVTYWLCRVCLDGKVAPLPPGANPATWNGEP